MVVPKVANLNSPIRIKALIPNCVTQICLVLCLTLLTIDAQTCGRMRQEFIFQLYAYDQILTFEIVYLDHIN